MERPALSLLARSWSCVLGAGALLAVLGAKFRLIQFFGSDVPFGDQWFGELTTTYAPYLEGRFTWQSWFAPHFEHRIAWTRLLDLGLLGANGRWEPRLQLVAQSLLLLTAVAVLIRHVLRDLSPLSGTVVVGFIALFFGSQMVWENTLWGFQSQFYFLLLFSLVHVLETSSARPWSPSWWIGHAAGLANLFSMAGGPISAAALLGALGWRRWLCRERRPGDGFVAAWNLALVGFAWWLLPADGIGRHGPAQPAFGELFRRLCDVFSWPAMDWRIGLLVWAPALAFLARCVLTPAKRFGPAWLPPLVLLILGFCVSVTYARGGALASRYSDFYCVGVAVNLVCLLTWPVPPRLSKLKLALLWLSTVCLIQWLSRGEQAAFIYTLQKDVVVRQREGEAIRRFLRTGDPKFLRGDVAFDSDQIAALEAVRAAPHLRAILPQSLQVPAPLAAADDSAAGHGFTASGVPALAGLPVETPAWGSFGAASAPGTGDSTANTAARRTWTSAPVTARSPFVVFYVAGEIRPPATQLKLVTADGRTVLPLQGEVRATEKWVRVNFENPGRPFRIVATDADPAAAFAFSAPYEFGRWSWLATKLLRGRDVLVWGGWILFVAAALVPMLNGRPGEAEKTAGELEEPRTRPPRVHPS